MGANYIAGRPTSARSSHNLYSPDGYDPCDLRSALAGELTEFNSAVDINLFLSRLLLLVAQNRIAANRAAVLAGICSLLLRSLSTIDREASDELRPIMFGPPDSDQDESLQPS
jgi:hypothetical protein